MVVGLNPLNSNVCVLMVPEDPVLAENKIGLDYREVHQVIRELTNGIYVLNQTPSISLEALYDQGTWCNLPPGFNDTHIGMYIYGPLPSPNPPLGSMTRMYVELHIHV